MAKKDATIGFGIAVIIWMCWSWWGDSAEEKHWYEGGTLHSATVAEWKQASERNRLATCADFTWTYLSRKKKPATLGSVKEYRLFTDALNICIDKAVEGEGMDNLEVSETAVACAVMMQWGDP